MMLKKMREQDFDKVFSIMESSFPADEYRTYSEQKALLNNPKYNIFVFEEPNGEDIKAFISVWCFQDFAYVEHFAVNPKYRNCGLGSLILKEIKALFPCRFCLEVELPENDFAKRRIEFYKRNGFFVNDYPYIQPPLSKGKKSLPLIIMTTRGKVSRQCFDDIKDILYREVYNAKL